MPRRVTAADIAAALTGRRSGDGWQARCPAHDDHTPSLSITEKDGRILVHCHAGCSQSAVIEALRQRGLWHTARSAQRTAAKGGGAARTPKHSDSRPRPVIPVPADAPKATFGHPKHGKPSRVWTYQDATGALLGYRCRFERDGGKDVRPRTYRAYSNGRQGWAWLDWDAPRPLYGLDRLAARPDARVLIVEGEKTADAAGKLFPDCVPVTSPGGSNAADKADWSPLHGRVVIVWPDADAAGAKYAADVVRLSRAAGAADVRVVELPSELPEGWDLADPLPAGWTVNTPRELLANARPAPMEDADGTQDSIPRMFADAGLSALPESPPAAAVEVPLRRLADLLGGADQLHRAIVRNATIELLKTRKVNSPAALVNAALGTVAPTDAAAGQGSALVLSDPEPWPEPVAGAALLDEIARVHSRYVVLPDGAAEAAALWDLHTYMIDGSQVSPILALTSPQKRCGKSTALDVHRALVRRPIGASNITAAALFRAVEKYTPTLLIDEADTFLAEREELRGILNAGHTRSTAQVVRTVGDDHEPRVFGTFCPKAIAAIGSLPATIEDRAIIFRMKRRARDERVERLRRDRIEAELEPLCRRAARWATDIAAAVREADPDVPAALNDRAADNWRPLLVIADAAGGEWPRRARRAALLLGLAAETEDSEIKEQLLADVREIFVTTPHTHPPFGAAMSCTSVASGQPHDRLTSECIVQLLVQRENRPWKEWKRGLPMTTNSLARLLKPFGIQSKQVWINGANVHGYARADFEDAWKRYQPAAGDTASKPLDPLEPAPDKASRAISHPLDCGKPSGSKKRASASKIKASSGLAAQKRGAGAGNAAYGGVGRHRARARALAGRRGAGRHQPGDGAPRTGRPAKSSRAPAVRERRR